MLFDDDDDELEKDPDILSLEQRRAFDLANGAFDSTLRGAGGIYGAVFAATKNTVIKAYDESRKNRTNYKGLSYELIDAAPPISSKLQKLSSAGAAFDYNKWEIKNRGFSLNNPAVKAGAQFVTAVTTIPLDRLVVKSENIKNALAADTQNWQRVASLLGYQGYEIGLEDPGLAAEALIKKADKDSTAKAKREDKFVEDIIRKANMPVSALLKEMEDDAEKRRATSEKSKATKERREFLKDSINKSMIEGLSIEELKEYNAGLAKIQEAKDLMKKNTAKRAAATRAKNKKTKDSLEVVDFFNRTNKVKKQQ